METETYTRKMASIQEVNGVYPIEGADKICQYGINGWKVVDQVGKYKVGDLVVFCEVDSFIPTAVAPFLTKPGKFPKIYNEVEGEKLRTIRLRKALSQGLILPVFNDETGTYLMIMDDDAGEYSVTVTLGDDVSEILGIQKWEPPPEFTSADARGTFPQFIFKTDQERVQNCFRNVEQLFNKVTWQVSEKVEGQSHTAYLYHDEFGVCSRNLNLKDSDNTFWNTARKYDLEAKLRALGRNIAIQSEQVGPGISGNIYGHTDYFLFVFDIFDIDNQRYFSPDETQALIKDLGLTSVPILKSGEVLNASLDELLIMADGKSVLGTTDTLREGLVFKANLADRVSWKAVSNIYLEKSKD